MAIYIDEQKKLFTLSTNNTSYQMMADKYLVLNHLYYGENIGQEDMSYLLDYQDRGFSGNPYEAGNERDYSLDSRPQEYSTNGVGDYRINSVSVINADGSDAADWRYAGYTIEKGKYAIPGMPALYGEEKDADTLIVELADKVTGLHAFLYYSVWEERDIITHPVQQRYHRRNGTMLWNSTGLQWKLLDRSRKRPDGTDQTDCRHQQPEICLDTGSRSRVLDTGSCYDLQQRRV